MSSGWPIVGRVGTAGRPFRLNLSGNSTNFSNRSTGGGCWTETLPLFEDNWHLSGGGGGGARGVEVLSRATRSLNAATLRPRSSNDGINRCNRLPGTLCEAPGTLRGSHVSKHGRLERSQIFQFFVTFNSNYSIKLKVNSINFYMDG